jgi:hypothetical protein
MPGIIRGMTGELYSFLQQLEFGESVATTETMCNYLPGFGGKSLKPSKHRYPPPAAKTRRREYETGKWMAISPLNLS